MSQYPPADKWDDWVEWDGAPGPSGSPGATCCPHDLLQLRGRLRPARLRRQGDAGGPQVRGQPRASRQPRAQLRQGPATHNQTYDPERILYPLKRVGRRGEGKWKRVTWEEALDDIAAKMREPAARRDGIMYHVGRPGEDHYTNRCMQAWGVDGHNSHTNVCSASEPTRLLALVGLRPAQPGLRERAGASCSSPATWRPATTSTRTPSASSRAS
jgi:hypothetical protein